MNRIQRAFAFLFLLFALFVYAQLTAFGQISSTTAFRFRQGTGDPATCRKGEVFFNNTSNVSKLCTATNTWTPIATGSSSGMAIGGAVGNSPTAGGALFTNGSGQLAQDASALFVDSVNDRIGVGGNTSPSYSISIGSGAQKGFHQYTAGAANDGIKVVNNSGGATFAVHNTDAAGFSGIEYMDSTGTQRVFSGFNNNGTGEFRFNNFATSAFFDFRIGGTSRLMVLNNGLIGFGGSTSSFPAIKRSSANLEVRLADDSAYTVIVVSRVCHSGTTVCDIAGAGAPESAVTASVGSTYRRTDGGAGTSYYVKESGTGNTGWVAK